MKRILLIVTVVMMAAVPAFAGGGYSRSGDCQVYESWQRTSGGGRPPRVNESIRRNCRGYGGGNYGYGRGDHRRHGGRHHRYYDDDSAKHLSRALFGIAFVNAAAPIVRDVFLPRQQAPVSPAYHEGYMSREAEARARGRAEAEALNAQERAEKARLAGFCSARPADARCKGL